MIDIKYHIYSLAAVFFALAVGILIGTSFARQGPVSMSEKKTIARYEDSMRQLKKEIEKTSLETSQTKDILKNNEDFCKAVTPGLIKNKLIYRHVAIVKTGDYDITGTIKRSLEAAGAIVTSITEIDADFDFNDELKIDKTLISCGVPPPSEKKLARDKLFQILANTVYSGKDMQMLSRLEKAGVAKFNGDYERINKCIVIIGGASSEKADTADDVDIQLIVQLQQFPNIHIIGCEPYQSVVSYVPAWDKAGIATVDNADSAVGQICAIYALNGENAHFGLKPMADRYMPKSLELQ